MLGGLGDYLPIPSLFEIGLMFLAVAIIYPFNQLFESIGDMFGAG